MATTKTLSLAQLQKKRVNCSGCRNSFYNRCDASGNANSSTGFCWSLPSAKMVYRWCINMWTPMDRRDRFTKVRVYDCYHGEGNQRDIYMKRLPAHLGGDWADKKEERESAAQ